MLLRAQRRNLSFSVVLVIVEGGFVLALCFCSGFAQADVRAAQDRVEGCKWFSLALLQGNVRALYNSQMCGKYLNEAERSEYNRRVIERQAKRK